jgi:hypothetical protein
MASQRGPEKPLLIRGDGTHWEEVIVPDLTANYFTSVWGLGPDDVWVVGQGSKTAHHWKGGAWASSSLPTKAADATAVWGPSASEIYLATGSGLFLYDGTAWTATSLTSGLGGVTGSPAMGAWAWSTSSVWRQIGSTWVEMASPCEGNLWGTSPTSIWQGSCYYDGATWTKLSDLYNILAVHGPLGAGAVGVGYYGDIYALSPTAGTPIYPDENEFFYDVQAAGPDNVWIAGSVELPTGLVARASHWDGHVWTSYQESTVDAFGSMGVGADGAVFAGSSKGPWMLSGDTFIASPGAANVAFQDLWVAARDAAWAVSGTDATIYAFGGSTWQTVAHPLSASTVKWTALGGTSRDDVWVVGTSGMTMHWDGATWTPFATPSSTAMLSSVWAAGASSVWTASEDKLTFAWDGTKWVSAGALAVGLATLHGCSANELWAVAANGTEANVRRFDGSTWSLTNTGSWKPLAQAKIWCAAPGDIWLASGNSLFHHVP